MRTLFDKLGSLALAVVMIGLYPAAFLLSPFRLGRLLRTVSIPRMREHRVRTTLTALGIALGVAVLVGVVIVSRSIVIGVTQTVDDLAGKADLQVSGSAAGIAEDLLDKVREVPGVYKLTPVMQQIVTLRTARGARERLLVLGVDLLGSEDKYFRDYASKELDAIRRDPLSFLNSTSNIILSRQLANRAGLRLHDKVAIGNGGGEDFEIWGFIESEGVGRAFGGAVAVMYYPAMQEAFNRGRQLDRIDVAVAPGQDPERVARALEAKIGQGFVIERPSLRGSRVEKMLLAVRTALTMASTLSLLAGAFLVFNTISISIVQRKREIGILRALGTTRRQLLILLTLEGGLLGFAGSALGVLIGVGLSSTMLRVAGGAINQVYMQQAVSEVRIDPQLVGLGFLLGVTASIGAALLATRRAAAIRPVEALTSSTAQPVTAAEVKQPLWRNATVVGIGLLVSAGLLIRLPPMGTVPVGSLAACILIIFAGRIWMPRFVQLLHAGLATVPRGRLGVEAALATDNLPRDLGRTASTASGLMAAAALTISSATFIVSFVTSLQTWSAQTVPGDLFVTSGASTSGLSQRNTPMSNSLRAELLAIPGIARVRRTRMIDYDYRGAPVKMVATEVREFVKRSRFTPLEGTREEIKTGLLAGGVIVSENFARLYKVHRGARMTLGTTSGPHDFAVAGVIVDYSSDRGSILMDRSTFIQYWNDSRVDTFEVHVKPKVSPEAVRRSINEKLGEKNDLFVLTNREFRNEFVKAVDRIFSLLHVLEVVTLIVAALGMVTAVLANVIDRVREIGVLRAVGMLRSQVRKMVVVESALTGMIGTLAGVGVGVVLGYILLRHITMVQIGWYLPYRVPIASIIELSLVTIPISALAGLYPAQHAASLVVSDALDYE
jgi:putative ABC transport system permease protein